MRRIAETIQPILEAERGQVNRIALRAEASSGSASPGQDQEQFGSVRDKCKGVTLSVNILEAARVVSYHGTDDRSRPYEMLRTQVLRVMENNDWQVLAVTSPNPRCGKTVTALNLALSIARQSVRDVVLVDANLRAPAVATYLGVNGQFGLIEILQGHAVLQDTIVKAEIGSGAAFVLPSFMPVPNSSDLLGSGRAGDLMQRLRGEFVNPIIILDTPAILPVDDTLALLPAIDCVLLVVGAGQTTPSELDTCRRYLEGTNIVRTIFNRDRGV